MVVEKEFKWYNGNIQYRISFKNGRKDGKELAFYLDGVSLRYEIEFVEGIRQGIQTWYHRNGKLKTLMMYKDNLKIGIEVRFDSTGKVAEILNHTGKGDLVGLTGKSSLLKKALSEEDVLKVISSLT